MGGGHEEEIENYRQESGFLKGNFSNVTVNSAAEL